MLSSADPGATRRSSWWALRVSAGHRRITKVSYFSGGPVDTAAVRLIASVGLTPRRSPCRAVMFGNEGGIPAQAIVMPFASGLGTLAVGHSGVPRTVRRPRGPVQQELPYFAIAAVALPLVAVASARCTGLPAA